MHPDFHAVAAERFHRVMIGRDPVHAKTHIHGKMRRDGPTQNPARLEPSDRLRLPAPLLGTGARSVGLITFDMGGTSTDVCLVQGGTPVNRPYRLLETISFEWPSKTSYSGKTGGAGRGGIAGLPEMSNEQLLDIGLQAFTTGAAGGSSPSPIRS